MPTMICGSKQVELSPSEVAVAAYALSHVQVPLGASFQTVELDGRPYVVPVSFNWSTFLDWVQKYTPVLLEAVTTFGMPTIFQWLIKNGPKFFAAGMELLAIFRSQNQLPTPTPDQNTL